jgi:hypothetical protein
MVILLIFGSGGGGREHNPTSVLEVCFLLQARQQMRVLGRPVKRVSIRALQRLSVPWNVLESFAEVSYKFCMCAQIRCAAVILIFSRISRCHIPKYFGKPTKPCSA